MSGCKQETFRLAKSSTSDPFRHNRVAKCWVTLLKPDNTAEKTFHTLTHPSFSHAQYRKTLNLTLDHLPNLLADHTLRKVSLQFNTLYLLLQDEK